MILHQVRKKLKILQKNHIITFIF